MPQRTTVYAANGDVIDQLGIENRSVVRYRDIPEVMIDAIIATEDRTFFTNPGIDLASMMRALRENISSGQVEQGGSTITQQLVKNRILTSKRNLDRKVREMVLAYRITDQYTKKQILTEYLNTVYFGQGSYGVASAAERFFKTDIEKLDAGQAALLAGIVKNPEAYNPWSHPEAARARRTQVLGFMQKEDYLTHAEVDLYNDFPLPTELPPAELRPDNYFVEEVQRRLLNDERLGATPDERRQKVLRGGLRIHTTYDARAYFFAQAAVNSVVPNQPPFTAAMASIDPANGDVRAIVGGKGFDQVQFNLATQASRQGGSTWKMITLAAAIEAGYSPNDSVDGSSPCSITIPGYVAKNIKNAEGGGSGETLRSAAVHSVNCAFMRVIASLGPKKVIDMAHRMGIKSDIPDVLSITLGTSGVSPLEMATVGATLAADGVRHDPIFVTKVEGPDGQVIFQEESAGVRVMAPEVARTVTDILRGVVTSGTGTKARLPDGRVSAGKTGTTDNKTDAWFVGYTPQLVTAVWMGDPNQRTPMRSVGGVSVFGGSYPARVWHDYMAAMMEGMPKLDFIKPDPKLWPRARRIDPNKGRVAGGGAPPRTAPTVPGVTVPPAVTIAPPVTAPGDTTPTLPPATSPPATSPPETSPPETSPPAPTPSP